MYYGAAAPRTRYILGDELCWPARRPVPRRSGRSVAVMPSSDGGSAGAGRAEPAPRRGAPAGSGVAGFLALGDDIDPGAGRSRGACPAGCGRRPYRPGHSSRTRRLIEMEIEDPDDVRIVLIEVPDERPLRCDPRSCHRQDDEPHGVIMPVIEAQCLGSWRLTITGLSAM